MIDFIIEAVCRYLIRFIIVIAILAGLLGLIVGYLFLR